MQVNLACPRCILDEALRRIDGSQSKTRIKEGGLPWQTAFSLAEKHKIEV